MMEPSVVPTPLASYGTRVRGEPGAKAFVDDLLLGRGLVHSRAVPSLRSTESLRSTQRFLKKGDKNKKPL